MEKGSGFDIYSFEGNQDDDDDQRGTSGRTTSGQEGCLGRGVSDDDDMDNDEEDFEENQNEKL